MKHSYLVVLIWLLASSCLKDEYGSSNQRFMPVDQYVIKLKSGSFNYWDMPIYEVSDIVQLLKYARDEYKISVMTTPLFSSVFAQNLDTTVGMMILWTIESTRLDIDHPSARPVVVDQSNQAVPQKEVAVLYERWWEQNKGKTIALLKEISPFEGTNFKWL